jgi:hypothetical protein
MATLLGCNTVYCFHLQGQRASQARHQQERSGNIFATFLTCLLFGFEYAGSMFLQNIGKLLPDCLTLHPRRQDSIYLQHKFVGKLSGQSLQEKFKVVPRTMLYCTLKLTHAGHLWAVLWPELMLLGLPVKLCHHGPSICCHIWSTLHMVHAPCWKTQWYTSLISFVEASYVLWRSENILGILRTKAANTVKPPPSEVPFGISELVEEQSCYTNKLYLTYFCPLCLRQKH